MSGAIVGRVAQVLFLFGVTPLGIAAQEWVLHPASGPPGRIGAPLAYDTARNEVVLFGGYSPTTGTTFDDTWTFDGTTWTRKSPATVPPRRDSHAMAYDSTRNVTTRFGGVDSSVFPGGITNQTWEWNGVDWTQRTSTNTPSPRHSSAMAFDAARGVQVLFGGTNTQGELAETWEWNGIDWTQRFLATSPPARTIAAMAFDATRGRIVMFGGISGRNLFGDTWEFDGVAWTLVPTPLAPYPRRGHVMAFDAARGVTVLSQGVTGKTLRTGDTWEFDGRYWYQHRAGGLPGTGGRGHAGMAFDIRRGRVVLFGGQLSSGSPSDTWEWVPDRPSFAIYGGGCRGALGTPELNLTTLPAIGTTFAMSVSGLQQNTALAWILGGASTPGIPLFGGPCELRVVSHVAVLGVTATGSTAALAFPIPNDPRLSGLQLFLQTAAYDWTARPNPIVMSSGARAVVW